MSALNFNCYEDLVAGIAALNCKCTSWKCPKHTPYKLSVNISSNFRENMIRECLSELLDAKTNMRFSNKCSRNTTLPWLSKLDCVKSVFYLLICSITALNLYIKQSTRLGNLAKNTAASDIFFFFFNRLNTSAKMENTSTVDQSI